MLSLAAVVSTRALPMPPPWRDSIALIGVTGTNGKTTTATMIAAALRRRGQPVPRTTTLGHFLDDATQPFACDYDGFVRHLQSARMAGGRQAVVEFTSEALMRGFAQVWPSRVGVFTNLTRDHFDVHGSAEHYLASKAQLFMYLPPSGSAVLNGCDSASLLLAEVLPPSVRPLFYGVRSRGEPTVALDLEAVDIQTSWTGTSFQVRRRAPFAQLERHTIRAIGEPFVENALAALAASGAMDVSAEEASRALADVAPPAGRFQVVSERPYVVVDYEHTPDALRRTLGTARSLCRGGLTVVFGAGGNRDRDKRPAMGTAAEGADRILLTSDNPRDEDPAVIVAAIRDGIVDASKVRVELDRAAAIRVAIREADEEDVIVLAGRGHELNQEAQGVSVAFSDESVARAYVADRFKRSHR